MRVVHASPDPDDRAGLLAVLRAAGHQVTAAGDDAQLAAAIDACSPELVLLVASASSCSLVSMARVAGAAPAGPYVLLVHPRFSEDAIATLLDAGVDAEVGLPLHPRGFAARLAVARRHAEQHHAEPRASRSQSTLFGIDWAALQGKDVGYVPRAPPPRPARRPLPLIERIARSSAWGAAHDHLRDATARFFSEGQTSAMEAAEEREAHGFGASIVLLSSESHLEVRISVGIDPRSAQILVGRIIGGGDWVELSQEMLNELANVYMGTMQAALTHAGFPFTSGLPEVVPVSTVLAPPLPYRHQHTVAFDVGGAEVVAHLGLRSRANVRVPARLLREGMVLAEDVTTEHGLLLANRGTRLSANMVERLRAARVAASEIEVMSP